MHAPLYFEGEKGSTIVLRARRLLDHFVFNQHVYTTLDNLLRSLSLDLRAIDEIRTHHGRPEIASSPPLIIECLLQRRDDILKIRTICHFSLRSPNAS